MRKECLAFCLSPIAIRRDAKGKRKSAASILNAVYPDPAAVRLNNMLRYRKSQTRAQTRTRTIRLEKSFKNAVRVFGWDANAGVVNGNCHEPSPGL